MSTNILAKQLKEIRKDLANDERVPLFFIFENKVLDRIVDLLPVETEHLIFVKGLGLIRIDKYGEYILSVVSKYCLENNITSPCYKLVSDCKSILYEFISKYDGLFFSQEIAYILIGNRGIGTSHKFIERIDLFYDVIKSPYYGILSSQKKESILFVLNKLIDNNLVTIANNDYVYLLPTKAL